jgi:hypothetical protein
MLAKVCCVTNIDSYKCEDWPTLMWNPKIGDLVESKKGHLLKIVQVTHCISKINPGEPYIQVELHAINEEHWKLIMSSFSGEDKRYKEEK